MVVISHLFSGKISGTDATHASHICPCLGLSISQQPLPSAETLRQRMDDIGSSLREEILNANVFMFNTYHVQSSAIEVNFIPVDLDVISMDNSKTHKEGVSHTYKGFDSYAPMMAHAPKPKNKIFMRF